MTGAPHSKSPSEPQGLGFSDILLLGAQYILGLFLLFAILVTPLLGFFFGSGEEGASDITDPMRITLIGLVTLALSQFIQGSYPWIVSARRDSTIEKDWKFVSSLPSDIVIALGLAICCFLGANLATYGMSALVGLDNSDEASNTAILTDNTNSPWLIGLILLIVVGAPLAEELLFRGYLLRTFQKYIGTIGAVLLSTLIFVIPHWRPDSTWQEAVVLWAAIGVIGLVLAIGAVLTDRLGPSVIAHFLFNGANTILALLA